MIDSHRWQMTAVRKPLERASFRPEPEPAEVVVDGKVAIKPFVETHPLDDINHVFDAVHHREISRRAVLVPA